MRAWCAHPEQNGQNEVAVRGGATWLVYDEIHKHAGQGGGVWHQRMRMM